MSLAGIVQQLSTGDKTIGQLAAALGLTPSTVEAQLMRLHFQGRAHVCDHVATRPDGGRRAALWRLGLPGPRRVQLDPAPARDTKAEDATIARLRGPGRG